MGENSLAGVYDEEVIRPLDDPLQEEGGLAVLRGNLAPDGCVIKHSAADPGLLRHTGPAVVFDGYDDLASRIDDPNLKVDADSVLVLRGAGPIGAPGMPEWGLLPIPKKLLERGVRDMVRISDARMSGTAYGTCVLHVAPESHVGGPLALVRDGDTIELDVPNRRLRTRGRRERTIPSPRRVETPPNHPTVAATGRSSPGTQPRPTKAATSISWHKDHPSLNPRSTDPQRAREDTCSAQRGYNTSLCRTTTREQGGGPGRSRRWGRCWGASPPTRGLPHLPRRSAWRRSHPCRSAPTLG